MKGVSSNGLFIAWLESLPAGLTSDEMWNSCPVGSWLLEYAYLCKFHATDVGRQKLVDAAIECARLTLSSQPEYQPTVLAFSAIEQPWRGFVRGGDSSTQAASEAAIRQAWTNAQQMQAATGQTAEARYAIAAVVAATEAAMAAVEAVGAPMQNALTGYRTYAHSRRAAVEAGRAGLDRQCAEAIRKIVDYQSLPSQPEHPGSP